MDNNQASNPNSYGMAATGAGGQDPNRGGDRGRGNPGGRGNGVQKSFRHRNKCNFCGSRGHYQHECELFWGMRHLGRMGMSFGNLGGRARGGHRGGQRGGRGGGHQDQASFSAPPNDATPVQATPVQTTPVQTTPVQTTPATSTEQAREPAQPTSNAGTGHAAPPASEQGASDATSRMAQMARQLHNLRLMDPEAFDQVMTVIASQRNNPEERNDMD